MGDNVGREFADGIADTVTGSALDVVRLDYAGANSAAQLIRLIAQINRTVRGQRRRLFELTSGRGARWRTLIAQIWSLIRGVACAHPKRCEAADQHQNADSPPHVRR